MAKAIEWRDRVCFFCPGCNEKHCVPVDRWQWNGDTEKPSLTPSLLIRSGHYAYDGSIPKKDTCWCTYNAEQRAKGEEESGFACSICHVIVTDGKAQFCSDSTHALSGQTVELPDVGNEDE